MPNLRVRAGAALVGALALGSCADDPSPQSVTGLPSLNVGRGNAQCDGVLPPGVYDNVEVPPNGICLLTNSTVRGNVVALRNSYLTMRDNQVQGNVKGDKATQVVVQGGSVGGNIQITEGTAAGVGASINGTTVRNGNIQVEKMNTSIIFIGFTVVEKGNIQAVENVTEIVFQVANNEVAQNIQVYKNTGPAGKFVDSNIAGSQIQCFENTLPFVGGPNTAPKREGQCF
jgi:hypothetical protein